ncbi:MAG: sn-glycerol-3-phosphate ABC transporter ATP-binding protein UgpC [Erysipelotrichaceae bacterium]|nr:sn-glycerol-3-phosphate ABC transporter ATP-binding protein UgpC [Erysipelotrichaceae bacterium]
MAEIILKNITKEYENGFQAVKNIDLEIKDNEFVILVGPSGCGKSTTLRMIAGLEDISDGDLYLDGKRINDVSPQDRDIAMVFQNYALYPHMTVYQNIAYSLKIKKVPKDEIDRRVKEVAASLGLTDLLDRRPGQLSGGQKQRVAMGRAIIRHPKAFLMDEPLSNLDAKLRGQMRVEIADLYQRLNTTFIYVTHDQTEAMTLGTKIVVMKDGEIQQIDSPTNLFNYPVNKFVAGFIGTPTMNFFDAECLEENGELYLKTADGKIVLTPEKQQKLREGNWVGKKVTGGIRPEHVRICSEEETAFKGNVSVFELLGSNAIIYVQCGEERIVINTDETAQQEHGKELFLNVKEEKLHIFDPESERTITN